MISKPKIFLGSSSEAKRYAEAIISLLPASDNDFEIIPWYDKNFFGLSEFTLSVLETRAGEFSFGIFIMGAEDITVTRGKSYGATRDNVVFELGLFIGKLGVSRCFFVTPSDVNYKIASDLSGITSGRFKSNTGDDKGALAEFVDQIKTKVSQIQQQSFGNLSGTWHETWYAAGSKNFPAENADNEVVLRHEGTDVYGDFKAEGKVYRLEGKVRHNYVIGEWFDPKSDAGYRGSFQLRIALSGDAMSGIYTGNSETSVEINSDRWVWTRNK